MKKNQLAGVGLLLIILAVFLIGFDAPVTGITYITGVVLLFIGGFPWICKLHWFIALVIGGLMIATTFLAATYIPLIIKDQFAGDERNNALVNLVGSLFFWPGIILISMTPIIAKRNKGERNKTNRKQTP